RGYLLARSVIVVVMSCVCVCEFEPIPLQTQRTKGADAHYICRDPNFLSFCGVVAWADEFQLSVGPRHLNGSKLQSRSTIAHVHLRSAA
ncbi:hypothetical protein TNCV_5112141, partial [Trichonephila clavipes]